ncbi:hypothetical protein ACIQJT_40195 [Streptomyces sp. NPDC091972]|uniref:hypothetical protein n=1 Tax=Streptomyces sp. NPDC091972 TaxID=3366007 RepID=UPI0038287AE6
MGNAPRLCAACGVEFVPAARRRGCNGPPFCTAACRAVWERTHRTQSVPGPPPVETVPLLEAVEAVQSPDSAAAAPLPPLPPLGTQHSCPQCGHEFTVVNFVLPGLDSTGDTNADDSEDVRDRYSTG